MMAVSQSQESGFAAIQFTCYILRQMDRRKFEKLVDRAIQELPKEFRKRLENVAIIIEDSPSDELLDELEVPEGDTLFGLYEGVPLTERGFEAPLYPDRIRIFQDPIEEECDSEDEIKEEIKTTIVHEIAHFFGLDDDYLDELGY
jgi:predicted Zn-dependent protease with MMP-like domain